MAVRCVLVGVSPGAGWRSDEVVPGDALGGACLATVGRGPERPPVAGGAFHLDLDALGLADDDPTVAEVAAARAGCRPRDLVAVVAGTSPLARAVLGAGARVVGVTGGPADVAAALRDLAAADADAASAQGVGPHAPPWPDDPRLDPDLLRHGDRRNVEDRYRYWRESAIVADLDSRRHPVQVAVENWQHDLNIGTVVRNANAFNVAAVHIVGRRRWNRRGAMATDRYLTVHHHPDVDAFAGWAHDAGLPVVGVDNVPGAVPLETAVLPRSVVLAFGQEGPGLSAELRARCQAVCAITQHGSTRSLNAGVASGIALYAWARAHAGPTAGA